MEFFFAYRNGDIDVFLDDTPIQEFTLSNYDVNCSTKLTGRQFGENFYAFGLRKEDVWLKVRTSLYKQRCIRLYKGYNSYDSYVRYSARSTKNKLII